MRPRETNVPRGVLPAARSEGSRRVASTLRQGARPSGRTTGRSMAPAALTGERPAPAAHAAFSPLSPRRAHEPGIQRPSGMRSPRRSDQRGVVTAPSAVRSARPRFTTAHNIISVVRQEKPGQGGHHVAIETLHRDPRVKVPTGQDRGPSAGSESCVGDPRGRLRSVDSGCMGGVIEPREQCTSGGRRG